jgi:hypothetical protein
MSDNEWEEDELLNMPLLNEPTRSMNLVEEACPRIPDGNVVSEHQRIVSTQHMCLSPTPALFNTIPKGSWWPEE